MDLSLVLLGTGGSAPTARRGLPATLLRRGGDRLLVDCGEGTQRQLVRSVGLTDVDAVLLTHLDVDHWLGLVGLVKTYELRDRDRPLEILGPPGTRRLLDSLRHVTGRTSYGLRIRDLEAGDALAREGYRVEAVPVDHRGVAHGYVLVEEPRRGRFDVGRARELGVEPGPDFGRLQRGEPVGEVRPEDVIGETRRGRKIVLSGDTRPCEELRLAALGADVLVHEATFTEDEADRADETGHSTAAEAAELARDADVRMLLLTHLSMRYGGGEIREEARAVFPGALVPRDLDHVEVPFPERGEPVLVPWAEVRRRAEAEAVGDPA